MDQDDKSLTLPEKISPSLRMGWQLCLMVGMHMLLVMGVIASSWWLTKQVHAPWTVHATAAKLIALDTSEVEALAPYQGWHIQGLQQDDGLMTPLDARVLVPGMRWSLNREDADTFRQQRQALNLWLKQWQLSAQQKTLDLVLSHGDQSPVTVPVRMAPKGWHQLGWSYWLLTLLALTVVSAGLTMMVRRPQWRNAAFLTLTLAQGVHIYLMAIGNTMGMFAPWSFVVWESGLLAGADIATGAALIQVAAWHPGRMARASWITAGGWFMALCLGLISMSLPAPADWWVTHASPLLLVGLAIGVMAYSLKHSPHPIGLQLRRLTTLTLLTWAALMAAICLIDTPPDLRLGVMQYGFMVWHVFFAIQLVLAPYLSRTPPWLQELALLSASGTVASSLVLVLVAVFALNFFTTIALTLLLAMGSHVLIRRWVIADALNRDPNTTERLFERLYRMARELERRPDRLEDVMQGLMRELFDPRETDWLRSEIDHSEVKSHGSILLVPLPHVSTAHERKAFVLKHADKGRRLFTEADALLTDRIVDQIDRALRYDRAVEHGRSEERMRLAQDLHDDIGARLLTLMYQAPNPSIEEYIRHTLQDLKTLTRGLAVQSHTLADAASEWKRDVSHRLQVAQCEFDWHFASDQNPELSVVQWSALTRILRELVNNTISHAKASKVKVSLTLTEDCVRLLVSDNGIGKAPGNWTHGLGLGGVRKRVKQLGGQVTWHEVDGGGISCEVLVPQFSRLPQM